MAAGVDTAAAGLERCVSCDAPLSGPYCSRCGEQKIEPDALTLRHFLVHTVASELLSIDGKLWRTLALLFTRPGRLALEYSAGRRRAYLNPFRLLLMAIVAYALMYVAGRAVTLKLGRVEVSIAPAAISRSNSVEGTINSVDPYRLLQGRIDAKRERLGSRAARERFHDLLAAFVQPASFMNVIVFAVALQLLFRSQRRRFLEHAAFSMHFISFVFFTSLTFVVLFPLRVKLGAAFFLILLLLPLWQFLYLSFAIRRYYLAGARGAWLLSVTAAMFLYLLNSAYMTAVQLAGAAIALALA